MSSFEKLGVFYLGKTVDPSTGSLTQDYLLYDSKDLVTHSVCVGMTGSGKTGMCVTLLEEAAIDGIPAIIIDPKGDLADMLLTFPELSAEQFRPWINEDEARNKGLTPEACAAAEAERWKKGLAQWDQDGDRIRRLRAAAEFSIYTPGSTAGRPVSITDSFAAPPPQYLSDAELLRERISATASGLLGLLGIQADPLRSREHILISKIFEQEWMSGRGLDLAALIRMIQSPPMQRIGVFDLESFYPAADRLQLAMMLNNLLAAPGFSTWLEGEPLDIGRMLHSEGGKPRHSIFSIAHLSDAERMFFVTLLLNQTISWMRTQPGTSSLRAILYMDEIFGFFPPVAEPPSKRPLLTLLKQARAFGLGIVLATQNPVDLDYKGLANAGTWFIGRLQTERDRERLLDGLAGAAGMSSMFADRAKAGELLAGLKQRVFLMQNAHEDHPVLFQTRWALSYLPGPLTRAQIRRLTQAQLPQAPAKVAPAPAPPPVSPAAAVAPPATAKPQVPPDLRQYFAPVQADPAGGQLVYHPFLFAGAKYQLVNNTFGIASTQAVSHTLPLEPNMIAAAWEQASPLALGVESLGRMPAGGAAFAALPTSMLEPRRLQAAQKSYTDFVYRESQMVIFKSPILKISSQAGESERDFRIRLQQVAREQRDMQVDQLRQRYAVKITSLQQRLLRAQQKVERQQQEFGQQKVQTAISVGATLLGALMGRKALSVGNLGRATTATRQASRISREKDDVQRAQEEMEQIQQQLQDLEQQLQQEADGISREYDPQAEVLQQVIVRPARAGILVQNFGLLWMPFEHDPSGETRSLS